MVLGRVKVPPTIVRRRLLLCVRPYSTKSQPAASRAAQHKTIPKRPSQGTEGEWNDLVAELNAHKSLYPETTTDESTSRAKLPEPWLLQLKGTSSNLHPSDFYRLAPQSAHVQFWTTQSSLAAVTRARHPTTQEATDFYELYFESEAGALRYRDHAMRLHQESKAPDGSLAQLPRVRHNKTPKAVQGDFPWPKLKRIDTSAPEAEPISDATAEARAFTLAPPGTSLNLQGPLQPIVKPKLPPGFHLSQILLSLSGGSGNGMSRSSLGRLIAADGDRRNLRWRLRPEASVLPVRADMLAQTREARRTAAVDSSGTILRRALELKSAVKASAEVDNNALYTRYIVSLQDSTEAKRFAREWHMRRLVLNDGDNVFFVKTTSLW